MTANSTISAGRRARDSQRASRQTFLAAAFALAAISIALRGEATPDVSWLITMCERMLSGERAYVDILETTPPVPMLLYMPGAFLAKTIGGTAEFWTYAFAYASALGSLWLAARILPTYVIEGGRGDWLVLAPRRSRSCSSFCRATPSPSANISPPPGRCRLPRSLSAMRRTRPGRL